MKKLNYLTLLLLGLLCFINLGAQDILVVSPGDGTLNDAIDTYGGSKIYQLQAGKWYGLSATIENVDFHLQIIGEDYDDVTMPTTLQTGTTGEGVPFESMFAAKGDITFKNIYFMNVDINGQTGDGFLDESDSGATVIIDKCIIDPISMHSGITCEGGNNKLYFTNNIVIRQGHMLGGQSSPVFMFDNESDIGIDTCIIENNTFVSTGGCFLRGNMNILLNNFVLINHNTFVLHMGQLDWTVYEDEYYLTNNLFFDFNTGPYSSTWQPMQGADISMPKPALIFADTIPDEMGGETLPSTRIQYIQYNNLFRHQGFYDLIAEMNTVSADTLPKVNLQPFMWTPDVPAYFGADPDEAYAANREAHLFNREGHVNETFPMWKFGNYTYDLDPEFNDPMIYQLSDSLIKWFHYSSYVQIFKYPISNFPPNTDWPKIHWEPDGDISVNSTWPVFDGTYNKASTLTGSIEGLPLGDLNWYPVKKAQWEAEKDLIFAHMKAGNTERYQLTSVRPIAADRASFSRIYPNPVSENATIEFTLNSSADVEIAIYNTIGQQVKMLLNETRNTGTYKVTFNRGDLPQGVYLYTIRAGNQTETHKMIILK